MLIFADKSGMIKTYLVYQQINIRKDMDKVWKNYIKRIEEKIKASGYPRKISGEEVYDDICDQIDGKENGSYVLLSKFDDDVIFEYHISIMDSEFNLGVLTMRTPEGVFETDFDK